MSTERENLHKPKTLDEAIQKGKVSLLNYLQQMSMEVTHENHINEVFLPSSELMQYCKDSFKAASGLTDNFMRKVVTECALYLQAPLIQDDFKNHEQRREWKQQLRKYLIPSAGESTLSPQQLQVAEFRQFVVSDARSINNLSFLAMLTANLPVNTLSELEKEKAKLFFSRIGQDGDYRDLTNEEKISFVAEVKQFVIEIIRHNTDITAFSGDLY